MTVRPATPPGPWGCVGGGTFSGNSITLGNGQNAVCGLNNDDLPATVTLVKTVVNDNGGTAEAEDWTLSATGPESISGATGSPAVTQAVVPVGPYTLSETGPAGYTASDWVCTSLEGESTSPLSVDAGVVALAGGANVTCTITNDDIPVTWDLHKVSDPPTGAVVRPGDTITYTVTATNTGGVPLSTLTVADDLADVFDNATLVAGSITTSIGTASVTGTTLNWSIPTLTTTATVTYKVTVNADAFNTTLVNAVTGDGDTPTGPPPTNCPTAPLAAPATAAADDAAPTAVLAAAVAAECTTTHPVGPPPTTTTTAPPTTTRPATPSGSLPFTSPPKGSLPFTGSQSAGLLGIGVLLLGLGLGLLAVRRRRGGN